MTARTIIPSLANLLSGLFLSSQRPCNIAAFHVGRSGSSVLGDLLKQHPSIVWDGELFSPGRLDGIASRWHLLTRDRMKVLRLKMTMAGRNCYGFETQATQITPMDMTFAEYCQRLEQMGFSHFVLLERKNHLRRIVSILQGHHSSRWHLKNDDAGSIVRIKLDVDECSLDWGTDTEPKSLIAHLQHSESVMDTLKQVLSSRRHLLLTYEDDILAAPEVAYRRVCDFTEIDYQPVNVRFKRTNPYGLADVLTNFSEVEQALRGTSYEWMLHS